MSAILTSAAGQRRYEVLPLTSPPNSTGKDRGPAMPREGRAEAVAASPREYAYRIAAFLITGDFVAAFAAIFAGLQVREWQRLEHSFAWGEVLLAPEVQGWALAGGVVFIALMVLLKTYETTNIYRMRRWFNNLLRSVAIWSMAAWACIGLFQITGFAPRVGVLYCALALVGLLTSWRLAAFVFLVQPARKEAASSRIIVVGWSEKASELRRAIRNDLGQLKEIIGCVPLPKGRFAVKPPPEVAVLGKFSELPELAARCRANTVVLADLACTSREVQNLITFCHRGMVGFQMIPEYFPALSSSLQVQVVSGIPLLGVNQLPLDRTVNRAIKRCMDIVGGLAGLLLSLPLIGIFATIVYLEDPGPVIFSQWRTSRNGRRFRIYKIRSMRINAEAESGAVWCKRDDPRRLKVGAFMRRCNIDELPQFWNVLKGDMSLVGPRPERPELIEKFKDEIRSYNVRHEVRAGLTGWAQINGWRGDTDLNKRIEADLYYLENWSVFLDLYCLVSTFFSNKNAH